MGNRVVKYVYDGAGATTLRSTTWYARDAQGTTMAIYTQVRDTGAVTASELHMYGSDRLGLIHAEAPYTEPDTTMRTKFDRTVALKAYEMKDHLGNVRATLSDVVADLGSGLVPVVHSRTDYYPFGMMMAERHEEDGASHRYGFNTQEIETEISGARNHYTAQFWEYDSRTARRWELDPKPIVSESAYSVLMVNPVLYLDLNGDSVSIGNIYEKNEDGSFRYRTQLEGFERFASSAEGRKFILDHAQKGFELKGKIITDLDMRASTEGSLSKKGVDVSFMIDELDDHAQKYHTLLYMPGNAHTDEFVKGNRRVQFQFMLDKVVPARLPTSLSKEHRAAYDVLFSLDSWLHETLFHGELQEKNYLQKGVLRGSTSHREYFQNKSTYRSRATDILMANSKALGLPLTKMEILNGLQYPGFGIK